MLTAKHTHTHTHTPDFRKSYHRGYFDFQSHKDSFSHSFLKFSDQFLAKLFMRYLIPVEGSPKNFFRIVALFLESCKKVLLVFFPMFLFLQSFFPEIFQESSRIFSRCFSWKSTRDSSRDFPGIRSGFPETSSHKLRNSSRDFSRNSFMDSLHNSFKNVLQNSSMNSFRILFKGFYPGFLQMYLASLRISPGSFRVKRNLA